MSGLDWSGAGLGSTTVEKPFADLLRDATGVLGDVPTITEGPVVRWYDGERQITLTPLGADATTVVVQRADAAADEEYRSFESSPDSALPYRWRADDLALLPNGTSLPGERAVKDFDALAPVLTQTLVSLCSATVTLAAATGRSEIQLHLWHADPAHDSLAKADRWAARRNTSLTLLRKAGAGDIRVMPVGEKALANRLSFAPTAEGATEAAAYLLTQISETGARTPADLRLASSLTLERRTLTLSPFALGIIETGLWA
jgi:hypothetical protein